MTWQTPKVDWSAADGVRDTDFNRIEGNILALYNESARASKIIYISPTGDDENGLGTSASPYRSFIKALSVLPKNLAGINVHIHVAEGVYDEAVSIKGFSGGLVRLTGDAGFVEVRSLTVDGCAVYVSSLELSVTASVGLILTNGALLITTGNIIAESATTGANVNNCSSLYVGGTLSCSSAANVISCSGCSRLHANTITGIGIMNALTGSIITYNTSSVSRSTASGGRIYTGAQSITGNSLATAEVLEEDA